MRPKEERERGGKEWRGEGRFGCGYRQGSPGGGAGRGGWAKTFGAPRQGALSWPQRPVSALCLLGSMLPARPPLAASCSPPPITKYYNWLTLGTSPPTKSGHVPAPPRPLPNPTRTFELFKLSLSTSLLSSSAPFVPALAHTTRRRPFLPSTAAGHLLGIAA